MSQTRNKKRFGAIPLGLMLALSCKLGMAQLPVPPPQPAADPHDLSGYWEIEPDGRSIPPAQLASGVTEAKLKAIREEDLISARWCRSIGLPQQMDSPRPISITQGSRELLMVFETNTTVRHFYFTDKHTNPDIFDPTSTGESIAHWEGDTLVVDTIGFHATKGRMMIPGGGFRTEKSHLVERYKLLNADVLSVTSTWTDPEVFAVPQTYEYRYQRVKGIYDPRAGVSCDPWDKQRAAFVERTFTPEMKKKAEDEGATVEAISVKPAEN